MTTKHTPGPWNNRQTRQGSWRIEGPRLSSSARRLRPIVLADVLKHSQLPSDEPAANARLIAAAPDLLAALVDVLAYVESYCENADSDDPAHEMMKRYRAIIARAKGEA